MALASFIGSLSWKAALVLLPSADLKEREGDVAELCVDIVAQELGSNRLVVIESQLDATDHKHLGQL